jgi:Sec-independent protein translocase protein TatA
MMNIGVPELLVILFTSVLLLMPVVLAVWMIVTLGRIKSTQKSLQNELDTVRLSLRQKLEPQQSGRQDAGLTRGAPTSGSVCAWCGKPVTEEEAFWLRAGARLCPSCTEDAGRIAAEQRLSKGSQPPAEGR